MAFSRFLCSAERDWSCKINIVSSFSHSLVVFFYFQSSKVIFPCDFMNKQFNNSSKYLLAAEVTMNLSEKII